ncbi:MAG: UDP-N-acetylmuramate--L-alanine ligase [bacterium]|nr:UDP-N-acetylmuramate--L-alanine ligase [bacterium]
MSQAKNRRVHFVGIGGIGVSALAQWYLSEGWHVTGSDAIRSPITNNLIRHGAVIHTGLHNANWLSPDVSRVIYSVAVKKENSERKKATSLKIPQFSYAEALGELTKNYKTIAVAGAHGKSTTTALVGLMLLKAGFDPTIIVGTRLKAFGDSNFRKGKSEWLVLEADEFHGSFLHYTPFAAIITNIDREHLEFYKTFENIKKAFRTFISRVKENGYLVLNHEDKNLASLQLKTKTKIAYYDRQGARAAKVKSLLKIPGAHNHSNAMACDTLGSFLGIPVLVRDKVFSRFMGTWRRFEYRGIYRKAKIYDDYAHHPTEIKATLSGAREKFPKAKIWVIFQPHLAERLSLLFSDFAKAFHEADQVIILETYTVLGRESDSKKNRGAKSLAQKIALSQPTRFVRNFKDVLHTIKNEVANGDVLLFMGAGSITNISDRLVGWHKNS